MNKSKNDIAYELLKDTNGGLSFYVLWEQVVDQMKFNEEEAEELISPFYTDLSLDGRFITLGDNVWDLREKNSFDKVHIDMNDIYSDDSEVIEVDEGLVVKADTDEELFEDTDEKER